MYTKTIQASDSKGLTTSEVNHLRETFGYNVFETRRSYHLLRVIWNIVREPMFLLLLVACSLYFILGKTNEGVLMLVAMCLVTAISLYQEVKSSNAINELRKFTKPKVNTIRDGKEVFISAEELVPGDIILLEEGMTVPADAVFIEGNDCTVNESMITGESIAVEKYAGQEKPVLYQGAILNSGKCIARVTDTGNRTVLGKIGKSIDSYQAQQTLLQQQMNRFVKGFTYFGLTGFVIIFFVNFQHGNSIVASLLFALTLAMSAIPEEIPVAFSSFMALGAYRMSALGIISRQPQIIENLGAVSVICLDKTGTITENKMQVKELYDFRSDKIELPGNSSLIHGKEVLQFSALASEINAFDPMEKAIWECYSQVTGSIDHHPYSMVFEYPLQGRPPMMTHVYEDAEKNILVAAKGAPERIIQVCHLNDKEKSKILSVCDSMMLKGYRVIAVATVLHWTGPLPERQDDFNWQFSGLLALYDPPKKNMGMVINVFRKAGIQIKMLTGDHPATALTIARETGLTMHDLSITGEAVMEMSEGELEKIVNSTDVFARMFPDAKLKVIERLKANGEIVAMTGDGVNDGPALKAAHIGLAMGEKGTEIARQAADMVITDDNLARMADAIREGRKIHHNLRKAIRYIISIHIPIILTASLPVIFGWAYPNIFSPIHIIFLELIMGPTCSIFFEREPVEPGIMNRSPRRRDKGLFSFDELSISILQGLVITAGTLGLYYFFMNSGAGIGQTRTIVFTAMLMSNVFLTFANRSFDKNIFRTIQYKNSLAFVIPVLSVLLLVALHFIPPVQSLFELSRLNTFQFLICGFVSFISVMWFEVYKIIRYGFLGA